MSKGDAMLIDLASELSGIPAETLSALNRTAYAMRDGYRELQNYGRSRTEAPRKRRRTKKFHKSKSTGVYTGKMVPPLSYGNKVKMTKPKLIALKEDTGKVTDPEIVWVGLGVNYSELILSACKLLAHCIFSKANYHIANYDNTIGFVGNIRYEYYLSPLVTTPSARTVNIVAGDSLNDVGLNLFTDFRTFSTINGPHKFKEIFLVSTSNLQPQTLCTLNCSSLYVNLGVYQTLLLQNETLAGDSSANTDNVASNPLQISVFDSNSNIVYQKQRVDAALPTWEPWLHYNNTYPEIFTRTATNQFGADQRPNQLSKIFSNAKQTYRAILQPGEMKKVQLRHKFSGNWNNWLSTFFFIFANDGTTDIAPCALPGKSRIMAFDKMISTGDSQTTVGYELNQQVSGSYRYKKPKDIVPQYD